MLHLRQSFEASARSRSELSSYESAIFANIVFTDSWSEELGAELSFDRGEEKEADGDRGGAISPSSG